MVFVFSSVKAISSQDGWHRIQKTTVSSSLILDPFRLKASQKLPPPRPPGNNEQPVGADRHTKGTRYHGVSAVASRAPRWPTPTTLTIGGSMPISHRCRLASRARAVRLRSDRRGSGPKGIGRLSFAWRFEWRAKRDRMLRRRTGRLVDKRWNDESESVAAGTQRPVQMPSARTETSRRLLDMGTLLLCCISASAHHSRLAASPICLLTLAAFTALPGPRRALGLHRRG